MLLRFRNLGDWEKYCSVCLYHHYLTIWDIRKSSLTQIGTIKEHSMFMKNLVLEN